MNDQQGDEVMAAAALAPIPLDLGAGAPPNFCFSIHFKVLLKNGTNLCTPDPKHAKGVANSLMTSLQQGWLASPDPVIRAAAGHISEYKACIVNPTKAWALVVIFDVLTGGMAACTADWELRPIHHQNSFLGKVMHDASYVCLNLKVEGINMHVVAAALTALSNLPAASAVWGKDVTHGRASSGFTLVVPPPPAGAPPAPQRSLPATDVIVWVTGLKVELPFTRSFQIQGRVIDFVFSASSMRGPRHRGARRAKAPAPAPAASAAQSAPKRSHADMEGASAR
jgi:hypothetical protein